jgi:excisionase family DNA binding protein
LDESEESDRVHRDPFPDGMHETFNLRGSERYTMTEASKIKGVSYHTVSRAVRQGRLPVFRLGRMALISFEDLENWQPMRERAPRRHRQDPAPSGTTPVILEEALGERMAVARQLAAVFEVIHAAASELSLEEFGELLANRFSSIFGLSRVSLWISNTDAGWGQRIAAVGSPISSAPDNLDISAGYGKWFTFIEMGKARVSLDPVTEFGDGDARAGVVPAGPLVIVPLRVRDRTIGALFGDRDGAPLALDEDQLSLAQVLGNQAALAVDNALLRKQERFRIAQLSTILDQMSEQVRACDLDGRLNLLNRADKAFSAEEGAPVPEIGSHALENPGVVARHELDGTPIPIERHPLARALRGEEVKDWEYLITRPDGRILNALVSARPLIIDGEITGAVYIGHNVSATRNAERLERERIERIERAGVRSRSLASLMTRLQESTTAAEAIDLALDCLARDLGEYGGIGLVALSDGGFEVVADTRLPGSLQMPVIHDPISISTTIMALSRMTPVDVSRPDAGRVEQSIMESLDASAMLVVPIQISDHHFGALHLVHDEGTAFDEEDLAFVSAVGRQCAQACDRIRLHDELASSRARLLGVIDQFPQAVLIVDALHGHIAIANAAFVEMWGEAVLPATVRADSLVMLDSEGEPFTGEAHPLVRSQQPGAESFDEEMILVRADGARVDVVANHAPLLDNDGAVVGGITMLQERSQLQLFDRSRARFLEHMVDELLAPISGMRVDLRSLQRGVYSWPAGESARQDRQSLDREVNEFDRVSATIERLLDATRADTGRLAIDARETDASAIIQSAVASILCRYPDLNIRVSAPQSILVVWDQDRIDQCIQSLLDNALRYAHRSAVDVDALVLDAGPVQIEIQDDGPGIPLLLRTRLGNQLYPFEEHTGVSTRQHGLGLGLYVATQLVRAHGGTLTIEERECGGTRVTMTLPRIAVPPLQQHQPLAGK